MEGQTEIIREVLFPFIKASENIYDVERLFVANTIIKWAINNCGTDQRFEYYINQVIRHLKKEVTLYWQDGIIKIKKERKAK